MPEQDKYKILYDAVSTDYDIGTFDEFKTKLNNSESRKAFYDGVGAEYALGTFDEFNQKLSPMPAQPTVQPTGQPEVKKNSTRLGSSGGSFLSKEFVNARPELLPKAAVDYGNIPSIPDLTPEAEASIKENERYLGKDLKSKLTPTQKYELGVLTTPPIEKKVELKTGEEKVKDLNESTRYKESHKIYNNTQAAIGHQSYLEGGGTLPLAQWRKERLEEIEKTDYAGKGVELNQYPISPDEDLSSPKNTGINAVQTLAKASGLSADVINGNAGAYIANGLSDMKNNDPQKYRELERLFSFTKDSGVRGRTVMEFGGDFGVYTFKRMDDGQLGAMRDLKSVTQGEIIGDLNIVYAQSNIIANKYKHLEPLRKRNEGLESEVRNYDKLLEIANSEGATQEDKNNYLKVQQAHKNAIALHTSNRTQILAVENPDDQAKLEQLKYQSEVLRGKLSVLDEYFKPFDTELQNRQNASGELNTHDSKVDYVTDWITGVSLNIGGNVAGIGQSIYKAGLFLPRVLGSEFAQAQTDLTNLNIRHKDLQYSQIAGFRPGVSLVKKSDLNEGQKLTLGNYNPGVNIDNVKDTDFVKAEVDEWNYFNLGVTAASEVGKMFLLYSRGANLLSATGMNMTQSSIMATTLSSYNDYYSQALNTEGLTESERAGFASVMSLFEGVTNLIMPDYKIFKGVDEVGFKAMVSAWREGGTKSLVKSITNFAVMMGKEISEEELMVLLEKANELSVNYLKEKQVFAEVDVAEGMADAAIITALTVGMARSPSGARTVVNLFNQEDVDAQRVVLLAQDQYYPSLEKTVTELVNSGEITAEKGTQIQKTVLDIRGVIAKLPEGLRSNYKAIELLGKRDALVAQLVPNADPKAFFDTNKGLKTEIAEVETELRKLAVMAEYESKNVKDITYTQSTNPDTGKKAYYKIQDGEEIILSRKEYMAEIKELKQYGAKLTYAGGTVLVEDVNGVDKNDAPVIKKNIYNEKTTSDFTNWYETFKKDKTSKPIKFFNFKSNAEKQSFIAEFIKRINPDIAEIAKPILAKLNAEIESGVISPESIKMVSQALLDSGHMGQSQGVTYDEAKSKFIGLDATGKPNGQELPISSIKGNTDWINPLTFTKDTPIHEMAAHPYVTALIDEAGHSDGTTNIDFSKDPELGFQELMNTPHEKLNPQAQVLKKGLSLMRGTPYERNAQNAGYKGEFGVLEEALVTAIGDKGAQLVGLEKTEFQKFLDDVLKWLNGTLFKNRGITQKEFENMSLRQYLEGVSGDLFQQGENVVSTRKTGKFSLKTVNNKLGKIFDNNPKEFERLKTKAVFAYEQQQTQKNSFNKPVMEGRSIAEAAEIYSGVLDFTRGFREGNTKENQQRLREYAKENGIYLPSSEQFQHGTPKVGEESAVFLQEDKQSVVKLTIPNPKLETTWYNLFDSHLAQGLLFPHVSYSFIGFTERAGGNLAAVFSQRAVPVKESTPEQIKKWGLANGFDWLEEVLDNPRLGVMLTDLHSKNVLVDGNMLNFIDPMIDITDPKKFYSSVLSDIYKDTEAEGLSDIVNLVDNTNDAVSDAVNNKEKNSNFDKNNNKKRAARDIEIKKLEAARDIEIDEAKKPNFKLELVKTEDLVNTKDPIQNRETHNVLKEKYKKLKLLIKCL
jgi:hypothetical protein